ncbi:hypothetical protein MMC09_006951 [Bachmanniomyces sp. S44760]|nr:hypothetical protein [Bachmanniomyces sp. S44760]
MSHISPPDDRLNQINPEKAKQHHQETRQISQSARRNIPNSSHDVICQQDDPQDQTVRIAKVLLNLAVQLAIIIVASITLNVAYKTLSATVEGNSDVRTNNIDRIPSEFVSGFGL